MYRKVQIQNLPRPMARHIWYIKYKSIDKCCKKIIFSDFFQTIMLNVLSHFEQLLTRTFFKKGKSIYFQNDDLYQLIRHSSRCCKSFLQDFVTYLSHNKFRCMSGNPIWNHETHWWMCHWLWSKEFFKTGVSESFLKQYWLNVFAAKIWEDSEKVFMYVSCNQHQLSWMDIHMND